MKIVVASGRRRAAAGLGFWLAAALAAATGPGARATEPLDTEQRVSALLTQMTLDEKLGQMAQADLLALANDAAVRQYALGSVLAGGDSDPADNSPETWLRTCHELQAQALQTRLRIPILFGIDAVHGHNNVDGAVIFPHNIGLGATRDPALVERAAAVVASEVAATGMHWTFAPCVAVAQDPRWGRTYESFGEQPELVGELGAAAIRGFQRPLPGGLSLLATAKHYLADGATQGGVDQGDAVCDEATLRKVHLAPYQAALRAEVGSIMVSFSSWRHLKMHANKYLLTDVLKGELGFRGFLVSDWAAIDQLGKDYRSDIERAINAGLDMVMIPNGPPHKNNYVEFLTDLRELVAERRVPQARIDDAVRRILRVKVRMGLFEHPYGAPELLPAFGSPEHRAVARACVRESLVLLKNQHQALPLPKKLRRLVVAGQAADDLGIQCGGWTIAWQGRSGNVLRGGTTLLAAVRQAAGPQTEVVFSPDGRELAGADAVLVVLGEKPYAEMKGDRKNLSLPPEDAALVERVKRAGVRVVTVLLSGRPLVLGSVLEHSDAFVAAWLPGTEGQGVADVLFGDYSPTGKLPRSWPDTNATRSGPPGGADSAPVFACGFGLSYPAPTLSQAQRASPAPRP